jgi:LPXTG-site transpeptidase (sortase) family protein
VTPPVGESRPRAGRPRSPLVLLGTLLVVVAAGIALFVTLGGRPSAPPAPSATPSLAAVQATASPSVVATPGAIAATPSLEPSASPGPAVGIVAKRIRIARLSIDLPIVEGDGVDAPMNKAAHYPDTAWPGGGSNIYIYGHAQKGMFLTLWDVAVGDEVVLDLVDGSTRTYRVSQIIPKAPWDAMHYLDPTPKEQLTLQTSTSYHPTSPRFVVIAVPAGGQ